MGLLRAAWFVAQKDLRVEWRSRELIYTTLFFALMCVLVFAFALVVEGQVVPHAAEGILWISIVFAGTLALGRAFERERQAETLRALLLAPIDRPAVYLGKLIGLFALLVCVEIVIVPLVGLFFNAPIGRAPGMLIALLSTGTLGFAAVGTLFAAMLTRAQSRDVLLPIALYPIVVPVIIGGVMGTGAIFADEPDFATAQTCLALLVFFDAVFVTLSFWTFEPVMTE